MVDSKFKDELASSQGDEQLTVVLQWPIALDRKEFAKDVPPQERMQLYRDHLKTVKASVVDRLAVFPDVQIRDLPSSGSAVVTTNANRFRKLIAKSGILGMHDEVMVVPNARFQTLSSTVAA
jgi:hypothetical protein